MFSGVQRAVRRALLAHSPVPTINTQVRWTSPPARRFGASADEGGWQDRRTPGEVGVEDVDAPDTPPEPTQAPLPDSGVPRLRLVGPVGSSFLIAEGPDGLYLIDQHAAHERVLFEKFMAQRADTIPSQALLEPLTLELPAESSRLLEEQLPVMSKLGFEVESFGPNAFKLRAMPTLLTGMDPAAALQVVIEDFEEDETPLQNEVEAKIIARVCKRAAVKAGQTLSPEEQKALITDLENCQAPRTCPHGRPTMIHLSIDLLERQFGRKGAR